MKKLICLTVSAMFLSISAMANGPSLSNSGVNSKESTRTKSTTTTLPSGEKVHQDSTTTDSTRIEAQEEDSPMMDSSSSHMNKKSGATTESMDVDDE